MKEALLLVNMGGPGSLAEVKPYLRAIFRDPAILPLPGLLRKPLANWIATRRAGIVAERYRKIGGGSPLLHWTRRQTEEIQAALRALGTDIPVSCAYRYCEPTIMTALQSLKVRGIESVKVVPMFPHYTEAMTGSILKEANRAAAEYHVKIDAIRSWWDEEEILNIQTQYLQEAVPQSSGKITVLFAAHGIPQRTVEHGEDYPEQVAQHAQRLAQVLPAEVSWSLAFQSRVGPVEWTRPYLSEEIDRRGAGGGTLLIMPLSFVCDCLETLYDLDIVAADQASRAGFAHFTRVRTFNDDPRFAHALLKAAQEKRHVQ